MSAPINSVLFFILGTVCITPLLSVSDPVAVPREGFRGRMLLSVEPGNKVGDGPVVVTWGRALTLIALRDYVDVKGLLIPLGKLFPKTPTK